MMVGDEYTIECNGIGGVPAPDLVAIVGASPEITEDDVRLEAVSEAGDGMVGGTVSKLFKYEPSKEHRYDTNYAIGSMGQPLES